MYEKCHIWSIAIFQGLQDNDCVKLNNLISDNLTGSPLKRIGDISYPSRVTLGSLAPVMAEMVGKMSRLLASSSVL